MKSTSSKLSKKIRNGELADFLFVGRLYLLNSRDAVTLGTENPLARTTIQFLCRFMSSTMASSKPSIQID